MSKNSDISIRNLKSFGKVAAEDDPVLDYFIATESVKRVESGDVLLVLGRKGTGKTAIVRHFAENRTDIIAKALNLRSYPWKIHETRIDLGASDIEAYVASWRYIITAQLASLVISKNFIANDASTSIIEFFNRNYGVPNPKFSELITPDKLSVENLKFEPQIFGCKIGSVDLSKSGNKMFGRELDALTDGLLDSIVDVKRGEIPISLHFDELDLGLSELNPDRKSMIIGLVLAARQVNRKLKSNKLFNCVIYLRSDIWDGLIFSDKNKLTSTHTLSLTWDDNNLNILINERIRTALGTEARWEDIIDDGLMRGSQTKWRHILTRTFLRPRDVIQFLNISLEIAKNRTNDPLKFTNNDINASREKYSIYLKQELDDEIMSHWEQWSEALQACSQIATVTFERSQFNSVYSGSKSTHNLLSADEALRTLFDFSVIGYEKRIGGGGSGWFFKYAENNDAWDNAATRFKVHPGLKEYAKLKEDRQSSDWTFVLPFESDNNDSP